MIIIYTFSSHKYGIGRFKRSKVLFNQLKHRFKNVKLMNIEKELLLTEKVISKCKYIIDLPYNADKFLNKVSKENINLILLDYYGNFTKGVHILIHDHYNNKSKKKYVGLKYAILNPKLQKSKKNKEGTKANSEILIVIGGSDLKDQGFKLAKKIAKYDFKVKLINGPLSKNTKIKDNKNLIIQNNPKNFYDILNQFNHIIVSGGMTLIESLFLNISIFAVPQNKIEKNFCKFLYSKKYIFSYDTNKLTKTNFKKFLEYKNSKNINFIGIEFIIKKLKIMNTKN